MNIIQPSRTLKSGKGLYNTNTCVTVKWRQSGYKIVVATAYNYIKWKIIYKGNWKENIIKCGSIRFVEVFFFFLFPLLPKFGFILYGEINSFIFKNHLFLECKVTGGKRAWEPFPEGTLCPLGPGGPRGIVRWPQLGRHCTECRGENVLDPEKWMF